MAPFSPLPTTSLKRPLTIPLHASVPQRPRSILSHILSPHPHSTDDSPHDHQPESRTWLYGLLITCLLIIAVISLTPNHHIEGLTFRPTMGQIWDEHIHIAIGPPLIRETTPVFEKSNALEARGRRGSGRERGRGKAGKEVERGMAKDRLERMIALKQGELNVRADTTPPAPASAPGILASDTAPALLVPTPVSSSSQPLTTTTNAPALSSTTHTIPKATPTNTFSDAPQADQPTVEKPESGHARQPTDEQSTSRDSGRGPQQDRRSRVRFVNHQRS